MKPIEFPEQTCVYAKDQPEYLPLPAYKAADGTVITCWKMSWPERLLAIATGKVWLRLLTFGSPLQPIVLEAKRPFLRAKR